MFEIHKLSKKYKFKIIEDASHALGSQYKNRPVGSCDYSEMCIFSFHPVKIITTCEGGVVTTNSKKICRNKFHHFWTWILDSGPFQPVTRRKFHVESRI